MVSREYTVERRAVWSALTSCSMDESVAADFAGHNGVLFVIEATEAADVDAYSYYRGGEREVLLPPMAELQVVHGLSPPPPGTAAFAVGAAVVRLRQLPHLPAIHY